MRFYAKDSGRNPNPNYVPPASTNLIVDNIVNIVDDVTKEEIEKYMKSTTKKIIEDYVKRYET